MSSRRAFVFSLGLLRAVLAGLSACEHPKPPPPDVDGGHGGEGGCPVRPPEPLFVLDIRAEGEPLPPDLRIVVEWSAGDEPPFDLSDATTWKTLDDGANFVCNVDRSKPPPTDLATLLCELWTSGPVNVLVTAEGFEPHAETLKPAMSELCGTLTPMEVAILLSRAKMDAGATP
ncbi:hypothetical protein [Polyangium sorediatum]|uniref:Lipoprotein n=1 Tax=Polyangium sorediatum TaxID=889274 RepID=A0ABT6NLW0_9BACT|nr:hypothetical protein [Polyangium sorediatum]MDI1429292.1 hypothetical protein [Polyangium sorediatum]